jgi:hypothetical protein
MHKEWYKLNPITKKYVKVIPLDIEAKITPRGLAHFIMNDGYWDTSDKTLVLCTDNFTLEEVNLLISSFKNKFDLNSTVLKRKKGNGEIC